MDTAPPATSHPISQQSICLKESCEPTQKQDVHDQGSDLPGPQPFQAAQMAADNDVAAVNQAGQQH
jgi:hypothetical protein